jgi:hypothetical protein
VLEAEAQGIRIADRVFVRMGRILVRHKRYEPLLQVYRIALQKVWLPTSQRTMPNQRLCIFVGVVINRVCT